eukprot:CAMPEP_0184663758 /NCGR_PEP_ID=MMETSP0308-20130426/49630_1 /TAXON_ID=38269 /ORGANISM="Gloeochaete witrockiana, Strain SAG 46.84" /LENGTH=775 /DNA_ID=CAMNT_0027106725 /DNA_START=189 /DNA_END=2516 /DNA_ORIENTATION=-
MDLCFCCPEHPLLSASAARFLMRLESIQKLSHPLESCTGRKCLESSCLVEIRVDDVDLCPTSSLEADASYTLVCSSEGIRIDARTTYGVPYALETLAQLLQWKTVEVAWSCPNVVISDRPRFKWRGLLLDVSRHFLSIAALKRNLDGMAFVKLNVLHLHCTDDQGFRIQSKRFPLLHEKGSNGQFYTQDEVRDVIQYASDRGIEVVPEFDIPGHSSCFLTGYPELASAPGPYNLPDRMGIHDACMDPTREEVYSFLDAFFEEMADLFPCGYVHIGGDEVTGKHWNDSESISEFKAAHDMQTNHDLHVYFSKRVAQILSKYGKTMIGWDEMFHSDLPKDVVVQSWRGVNTVEEIVKHGCRTILSCGYYLDHMRSSEFHYNVDPDPEDRVEGVLGGEACMWGELVDEHNCDGRIWPRLATFAERMWSPRHVSDVDDMYRRLEGISSRLEAIGIEHRKHYSSHLLDICDDREELSKHLRSLAEACTPYGVHLRTHWNSFRTYSPLRRLVDKVSPESPQVRRLHCAINELDHLSSTPASASAASTATACLLRLVEESIRRTSPCTTTSSSPPSPPPLIDISPSVTSVSPTTTMTTIDTPTEDLRPMSCSSAAVLRGRTSVIMADIAADEEQTPIRCSDDDWDLRMADVDDEIVVSASDRRLRDLSQMIWRTLWEWIQTHHHLTPIFQSANCPVLLQELESVSIAIYDAATIGLRAIKCIERGGQASPEWVQEQLSVLDNIKDFGSAELNIAILPIMRRIIHSATNHYPCMVPIDQSTTS